MKQNIRVLLLILIGTLQGLSGYSTVNVPVTKIDQKSVGISVQNWLVAGPIPSEYLLNNSNKMGRRAGYSTDFLKDSGGESKAIIQEGTAILLPNGNKVQFSVHQWDDPYIDLVKIFGKQSKVCAYLYCEVESKEVQEVFFHVGINDAGKVWVGGQLILEHPEDGPAIRSQNIIKVKLNKGRTSVLVKVDQAGADWGSYIEVFGSEAQKAYLLAEASRNSGIYLDETNPIALHLETKVLCKEPDRYIGWPTITKTKSNELLVVFSGNRDAHVCPYGITQMIRSKDNGMSWSAPETINNTPLDDRDAGIIETKRGTLVVSWFTSLAFDTPDFYKEYPEWVRHAGKLNDETKQQWIGNWTRRSTDQGKTWKEPVKQILSAPHGPIELADSRLLYIGTGMINGQYQIGAEESRDDGESWKIISTIEIPADMSMNALSEPHVVEISDGKLIAMFRYNPKDKAECYLQQSESNDGGKSWSVLHGTPIWGYPPHLIKLNNGWLLAVYGVRRKPYSERACLSKDGGKTWDVKNEIILSKSTSGDLGYPASVQLDDGSIYTVYYQIDQAGEKTCLMATHWKLK